MNGCAAELACSRRMTRMVINTFRQVMRGLAILALMFAAGAACAVDLNMPVGVTPISHDVYGLHMYAFWVCVGIGIVVFGLILISIIWQIGRAHV